VPFPPEIALATRNPGKVREILRICAAWPVRWRVNGADGGTWPDVEETGQTYLENALIKARAVAEALRAPALADDSGIEVDALGGAPGPRSARFAGHDATDEQNLGLLVVRIAAVPEARRAARYRCVAACALPDGGETWTEATCEGVLILEPRGTRGFGYDPIFVPLEQPGGATMTMAELPPEEKDRISHRGRALRALGALLEDGAAAG
jgi:XTP/dITP diphosphohydrolase